MVVYEAYSKDATKLRMCKTDLKRWQLDEQHVDRWPARREAAEQRGQRAARTENMCVVLSAALARRPEAQRIAVIG